MKLFRLDFLVIIFSLLAFQWLNIGHELSHDVNHEHRDQKCSFCLTHINDEFSDDSSENLQFLEYHFSSNIIFFREFFLEDIYFYSKSRSPPLFA